MDLSAARDEPGISAPFEKFCWTCRTSKSSEDFHVNNAKSDGLSTQCKSCRADYAKSPTKAMARRYAANVRRDVAALERVERLVAAVLDLTGLTEAELVAQGMAKPAIHARSLISWVGVRSRAAPTRIIGNRLNRKRMAVSRGVGRIDAMREKDAELRAMTDALRRNFRQ